MSGEVSFSINVPSASALERRRIWLRNSKLSRMSCTLGEKPLSQVPEVGLELLAARAGAQIAQGEPRGVVEGLPRRLTEGGVLPHDAGLVERGLHVENGLVAVFQHRVQPAQHGHRQDYVAILAAHIEVPQHIVRDAPDVVRDPVQVAVAHLAFILRRVCWRAVALPMSAPRPGFIGPASPTG